ncbi:DnaT-like ssDNA-binding protein [Pseudomonas sp. WP18]|uniref:DnaT-like ssDNA-binding protein n=1 Tax=Pseudomonas sp. WP18 TaxID=3118752 RepID=UPI0030D277F4
MLIIVEDGTGRPGANSFVPLEKLVFYRDYYGFPLPAGENEQKALLLRAAADMNAMEWKGVKTRESQPMAWPRRQCRVGLEILSETFVPFEIEWGQLRLAVELYAADNGFGIPEPAFGTEKDGERVTLLRGNPGAMLRPPPYAPSRAQFADYLVMRGLSIVP